MAQISYGTITITDTNDIENIIVEYNRNQSTSEPPAEKDSGWSTDRPAWAQGYYIWQRTRIHKSGTQVSEDTFGTAVCLTGSTGQTGSTGPIGPTGQSLKSTKTQYTNVASDVTITTNNHTSYTWTDNVPAYNSNKPAYWARITNTYTNPEKTEYLVYKDQGITDAIKTSYDANTKAGDALDKAGRALNNTSTLQTRLKYFWTNLTAHTKGNDGWTKPNYPVGTYAASGIDNVTFDEEDSSTYGYNTLYVNGINLRYNAINLGQLTGSSLIFYNPSTTSQGTKAMELSGSALKFYASDGATAQAEFGGTKARVSGTIQALDGQIGNNSNNYWYIGNYIDYNQNQSAAIKSHGTAFIQLGDSNTWRLATNRFHSAWNDDSSGTAGQLHYPIYDSKYWDSGLHLPTALTDKFLYIRNAPNTQSLENLQNDLEDSGYDYWTYQFYIDGAGNLHAGDIYSHGTLISGTSAPYLLKSGGTITGNLEVNGTLTKGSKNVAYLSATPTNGQILIADGTTGGIKTSGYTIATSVPSGALFTDKNVQTSQANTTKIYLTGTSTSGTNTGTLSYDSNVYLTTTAGTLHATTFEGNLSGTATKANQDGDGNVIKTTYLKLSGGNVTGPVSFGSSVNADELTVGDLVVNGAASFTNNLQANTINGVAVGSSPKFTDTVTTVTTSGNGNAVTGITASNGKLTVTKGTTFLTSYTETDPVFKASAAYGISSADISNWNSKTSNTGTVTSVRVQASSPLTSTTSTASSTTLDTTIKFANQNKNLVLAGPSSGDAAAPTFRSLVADDIPGLAWSKITSGKPTTLSGYGITDAAGLNALVGLSASSNSAGVTTFTATRASGTNPLSFEVSIVASAAAGANALRDSEGPISKGSVTKPVYFNNGVPAEANTYAGGTAVTLNNASKASSTASFYAPTSGGTTSQVLVGNGTTSAPTWKAISDIVPPKASTADAFSSATEVKLTGDTTGSASSTKGWSITTKTDRISTVGDNRAVATTPNDYINKIIFQGLKTNSSFGSPSTDTYSYVVGLRGWSDSSGGDSHEFAFNNSGINHRSGATTSWGAWEKLITSNNYTDYTVTKTGSGASGTWGISISGNAATASAVAWSGITGKPINFITNSGALNANGWKTLGGRTSQNSIAISYASSSPATWNSESYSASIVFGCGDTKGMVDVGYNSSIVTFGGGSVNGSTDNAPKWYFKLSGTSGQTYTFPSTSKTLVATDGTGASGTWGISISGTAAQATADASGNTITSTYVKKAGDTMTGALNTANGIANKIGDDSQLGDFNVAGTLGIQGLNGTTGVALLQKGTTWGATGNYAHITYDGTYIKANKLLQITANSNTVTIGSQNNSFTHIYNSASIPFIFNNSVLTTSGDLGNNTYAFNNLYMKGGLNMLNGTTQKARMAYNSSLDAIVFSFA